ncbi:MAG: helix-turn-helix domain-containing protein [Clostridia bacterium]|nr:helix-turn-helix domain-containing protein [Clostridia bacterium]
MNRYKPPEFETIKNAVVGDTAAVQKILAHYNAFILYFAKQNGIFNYVYAEEIRSKLMKAVLEFDIGR